MSNKRKYVAKPLVEKLQEVFCYYDDRLFPNLQALQDHMKSMHLKCPHCGKKMDTLNGLNVHVESVHKIPLVKVDNALPDRESPQGPEIYLMEGVPKEMVDAHQNRIITQHYKELHDYRVRTGNPMPGTEEAQNFNKKRKIEEETPEQKKAKKDAWIKMKREQRAAKLAAEANGGVAVKQEPSDNVAAQDQYVNNQNGPYVMNEYSNPYSQPEQTSGPYVSQPYADFHPGYSTSPPMGGFGGLPMTQAPQMQMQVPFYPTGPQYGYPPPNFNGQPYPQPNFPQQFGGYSHGGSPQGFPPQSMPIATHSPSTHASPTTIKLEPAVGNNGKSTMPAAPPGLPQKPSFNLPSYSKDEMAKFHHGHTAVLPAKAAATPKIEASAPDQASEELIVEPKIEPSAADQDSEELFAEPVAREDLIAEQAAKAATFGKATGADNEPTKYNIIRDFNVLLTGHDPNEEAANRPAATEAAATEGATTHASATESATAPAASTPLKSKKDDGATLKAKSTVFKVKDNVNSPEERKSKQHKYANLTHRSKRRALRCDDVVVEQAGTVVQQADSQAVTGSVADDLEQ